MKKVSMKRKLRSLVGVAVMSALAGGCADGLEEADPSTQPDNTSDPRPHVSASSTDEESRGSGAFLSDVATASTDAPDPDAIVTLMPTPQTLAATSASAPATVPAIIRPTFVLPIAAGASTSPTSGAAPSIGAAVAAGADVTLEADTDSEPAAAVTEEIRQEAVAPASVSAEADTLPTPTESAASEPDASAAATDATDPANTASAQAEVEPVEAEREAEALEAAAREEAERLEIERLEAERAEAERAAEERADAAREEAERADAELAEQERLDAAREEEAQAEEAARVEAERVEEEARAEAERAAAELAEAEREAAEREEAEREEAAREQAEREEAERAEAAQAEADQASTSDEIILGDGPGDARCLALGASDQGFGSIDKSDWSAWLPGVRFSLGHQHLSLDTTPSGRTTLRQQLVPSSRGTDRVIIAANVDEARTYRFMQSVYLEPGWDWGGEVSQGGKMGFGLGGGTAASGGKNDPSGFTARFIWRGNRDGTAKIAVYSYAADRPGTYGEDVYLEGFPAPIGEWFDLIMEVKLNSSTGASDGALRAWANGNLLLNRTGMAWQTAGSTPTVDSFLYSTFYGGSTSEWSPDTTTHLRLADVCWAPVVDGYSGIDPDNGRIRAPENDRPGGPGVQLDGAPLAFEPGDRGLRGSVRGLIESARVVTEFMLPTDDISADETLNDAVDLMNAALDQAYWVSADDPDIYAPDLLGLYEAIAAVDRAGRISGSVALREDVAIVRGELSDAARQLVDAVIAAADEELDVSGCRAVPTDGSCGTALAEYDRATSERELLEAAPADSVIAASHALEAYGRAVEVLRLLF